MYQIFVQNAVRSWFTRDEHLNHTVDRLRDGAEECFQAFLHGQLDKVADCVNEYRELKKMLLPGNEPDFVGRLWTAFQEGAEGFRSLFVCSSLAGAGGGGFLYGLLAKGVPRDKVVSALASIEGADEARIYESRIDYDGISVLI